MSSTSGLASNRDSTNKLLRFLFIFLMAGFVLTCVILYLSSIGLFEKWEIVATVPENAVEVINGDPWKAYIKTSDQKILSCPFGHEDECWIPDVVSNPYNSQPCNKKIVAFSPILNPPKNLVSCRQIRDGYLETGYNLVYAIDQNYHLWKWGINSSFRVLHHILAVFDPCRWVLWSSDR